MAKVIAMAMSLDMAMAGHSHIHDCCDREIFGGYNMNLIFDRHNGP